MQEDRVTAEQKNKQTEEKENTQSKEDTLTEINVIDEKGNIIRIAKDKVVCVNGKYYMLRKTKTIMIDISEYIPKYASMLFYAIITFILCMSVSKVLILVMVIIFVLSLIEKNKNENRDEK